MKNELDRNSDQPLYKQIETFILKNINNEIFKPNKILPSERSLAEKLKVSRLTVRRAIQELVQKNILYKEQGKGTYVKDVNNRQENNTCKIGIIPHLYKGVFMDILSGIEEVLDSENYNFVLSNSQNNSKKEKDLIESMKKEGVDGFIISPVEDQKDNEIIFKLKSEGYPVVLIDRKLNYCETDCVLSDNIDGGFKAAEYLIELGHSKIAFFTYQYKNTTSVQDRIKGYKFALEKNGLEFDENLLFSYDKDLEQENKTKQIYEFVNEYKPTAIIGVHNDVTLDVVKMCRNKKISIPDDISLICFDNTNLVKHLEVPITTLVQNTLKIGKDAARIILDKINSKENRLKQIYHPIQLIERNSCKVLKNE